MIGAEFRAIQHFGQVLRKTQTLPAKLSPELSSELSNECCLALGLNQGQGKVRPGQIIPKRNV